MSILEQNRVSSKILYNLINHVQTFDSATKCSLVKSLSRYVCTEKDEWIDGGGEGEGNFSLFPVSGDCICHIHDFFDFDEFYKLSRVSYASFLAYFPFKMVEKNVTNKVIWSEIDQSLDHMIEKKGHNCTQYANYLFNLFAFVNGMRKRRVLEPHPTVGFMLYKHYERSIEPLLLIHVMLFQAEVLHKVSVNIIESGIRACSFGLRCGKGVLVILLHSRSDDHIFMGEFVMCAECVKKLRMNTNLY